MLKHFVYLSTAKLKALSAQLPTPYRERAMAKTAPDLVIPKQEYEASSPEPPEHDAMQSLIQFLEQKGEIGTVKNPKRFFRGEFRARSLVDRRMVFFYGTERTEGQIKHVGLTGAMKHMIGQAYRSAEQENFNPQLTQQVADSELFISGPPASMACSKALLNLWEKDQNFQQSDFNHAAERLKRLAQYQLTEAEQKSLSKIQWANQIIHWINGWSLSAVLCGRAARSFIKLIAGTKLYEAKSEALSEDDYLRSLGTSNAILKRDDQDLLHFVMNIGKQIQAPQRSYEFVAMTLADGRSYEDEVVLGSPLYIADLDNH
jgi:hypothetical protein